MDPAVPGIVSALARRSFPGVDPQMIIPEAMSCEYAVTSPVRKPAAIQYRCPPTASTTKSEGAVSGPVRATSCRSSLEAPVNMVIRNFA